MSQAIILRLYILVFESVRKREKEKKNYNFYGNLWFGSPSLLFGCPNKGKERKYINLYTPISHNEKTGSLLKLYYLEDQLMNLSLNKSGINWTMRVVRLARGPFI